MSPRSTNARSARALRDLSSVRAFVGAKKSAGEDALSALRDRLIAEMSVVYTRTSGSLNLFCYRSATMKTWNRYAMQCQGAVIDLKGERLLVYPYDKFFQFDEIDGWRREDFAGSSPCGRSGE